MSKNLTVQVTRVKIGSLEIDGYLTSDNTFAVNQNQIARWMVDPSFPYDQLGSKYLEITRSRVAKKLIPQGVEKLEKAVVQGVRGKVNLIKLDQVIPILTVALTMGYTECAEILSTLGSMSLHQLFCDAFEIKFDKEDRQAWLTARMEGITVRNNLTDAIADYLSVYRDKLSINEYKFVYVHCTNAVYKLVFGKDAKQLRVVYKCDNPRNAMEREYLKQVEYIELTAAGILKVGKGSIKPLEAVQRACRLVESIGVFS